MKLRDALLAAPTHGLDRMSVEADRRLRRRLGLEAATRRPAWRRPAIAAFAVAAVVGGLVVIVDGPARPAPPAPPAMVALLDGALDVRADSPTSTTVTWRDATIVAAPGTHVATTATGGLVLTRGAIEIASARPYIVDLPQGRVVIAAAHAQLRADREEVTLLLADGRGQFTDADGQPHALVPDAPVVWPPAAPPRDGAGEPPRPPAPVPPPRGRAAVTGRVPVAPAAPELRAPPAPPLRPSTPGVPCTYKSDCDPGATCRQDDAGASVCMGNGGVGAACWFDGDCRSHRCTQRRCAE